MITNTDSIMAVSQNACFYETLAEATATAFLCLGAENNHTLTVLIFFLRSLYCLTQPQVAQQARF